jgi:hypothetical protein
MDIQQRNAMNGSTVGKNMRQEFIKSGMFIVIKIKPTQSLEYHKDVAYKITLHKSLPSKRHKKKH